MRTKMTSNPTDVVVGTFLGTILVAWGLVSPDATISPIVMGGGIFGWFIMDLIAMIRNR